MANQWTWAGDQFVGGDHHVGGVLTAVGGVSSTAPVSFAGSTLTLSAVATSAGSPPSTAVYTGTITGGANNAFAGASFTVTGFLTSANNGVDLLCTASTATTLTLANASAVSETDPATAVTAGVISIGGSMLDGVGNAGASGDMMTSSGPGTLWRHPTDLTWTVSQVTGAAPSASPVFTGTVVVDGWAINSTPPTTGQVLTAVDPTHVSWQTPAGGGAVASVFTRTGAVTAQSGDYSAFYDVTGSASTAQANAEAFATAADTAILSSAEAFATSGDSATLASAEAYVQTFTPVASGSPAEPIEFLTGYNASTGLFSAAQPAYASISGTPDLSVYATTTYVGSAVAVETSRAEAAEALLAPISSVPALYDDAGSAASAGNNHIASGLATLVTGTVTITLTGASAFSDTNYVVMATFNGAPSGAIDAANSLGATIVTGSSFTIQSTDPADVSTIFWMAIGF